MSIILDGTSGVTTPGVTGMTTPLTVAQGGTGVTTSTGSGNTVLSISPALTGIPTGPTASTNTSNTQIATTAFANPANSLATSGYQKLPSGLIFQWGSTTILTGTVTTFPIAFPTKCLYVYCTLSSINTTLVQNITSNTTTFTASSVNSSSGAAVQATYSYLAIGN